MSSILVGFSALVTGGTRGIGAAIAAKLIQEGALVTVTGTTPDGLRPEGCNYVQVNFGVRQSAEEFAQAVGNWNLDILINNAGINKISPFEQVDLEDFDRIQAVNLRVPFLLCQAVLPAMRRKKWGRIVNISSIFGNVSKEFRCSYSASKFALNGMTAALAAEVAVDGILANCVSPGFIDTELTRMVLGEEGMKKMATTIPIGRLGRPEEVAELVVWLAGPQNTYISGQDIIIDGGFTRV